MSNFINGDDIPFIASKKCMKLMKVLNDKVVDINATGHRDNNALLKLLKCECKESKICLDVDKSYSTCHSNIMGTGSYKGRKDCGVELAELLQCIIKGN